MFLGLHGLSCMVKWWLTWSTSGFFSTTPSNFQTNPNQELIYWCQYRNKEKQQTCGNFCFFVLRSCSIRSLELLLRRFKHYQGKCPSRTLKATFPDRQHSAQKWSSLFLTCSWILALLRLLSASHLHPRNLPAALGDHPVWCLDTTAFCSNQRYPHRRRLDLRGPQRGPRRGAEGLRPCRHCLADIGLADIGLANIGLADIGLDDIDVPGTVASMHHGRRRTVPPRNEDWSCESKARSLSLSNSLCEGASKPRAWTRCKSPIGSDASRAAEPILSLPTLLIGPVVKPKHKHDCCTPSIQVN